MNHRLTHRLNAEMKEELTALQDILEEINCRFDNLLHEDEKSLKKKPCSLRILILVDGKISFYYSSFGLGNLIDNLTHNPEWWVDFDLTLAHRNQDSNQKKETRRAKKRPLVNGILSQFNFKAREEDFIGDSAFDEVWIFGFEENARDPLSPINLQDAEREVLFHWMEQGGGIFACGDHGRIGEALCGSIPRVRFMQKWHDSNPSVANCGGFHQNTTLNGRRNHPAMPTLEGIKQATFDDQSDDVPAIIRALPFRNYHLCCQGKGDLANDQPVFPHPLLSVRMENGNEKGVINALPDHMHLGEVIIPGLGSLSQVQTFGEETTPEFPKLWGQPLKPEIIAKAWSNDQIKDKNNEEESSAVVREFGVIGVYNGHLIEKPVGRIVVDSSFHHWLDVNLTGVMEFEAHCMPAFVPEQTRRGFQTDAGRGYLAQIGTYHRNVAIWLAPPKKQQLMAAYALWSCINCTSLSEILDPRMPVQLIGKLAIEQLSKQLGEVHVRTWWSYLIGYTKLLTMLDPKEIGPSKSLFSALDEFMTGALLKLTMQVMSTLEGHYEPNATEILEIMALGGKNGLSEFRKYLKGVYQATGHLMNKL